MARPTGGNGNRSRTRRPEPSNLEMEELEIRFAGAAGQGIVLAARILSQTLSRDGKEVAQSQSYEPTSRGETSRSDVVIGNGTLDYPLATQLDVLVLLDEVGLGASSVPIKRGGMVLSDAKRVASPPVGDFTRHDFPFAEIARALGNERAANMVALGALAGLSGLCPKDSLEQTVRSETAKAFLDLNLRAVREGYRLGSSVKEDRPSSAP